MYYIIASLFGILAAVGMHGFMLTVTKKAPTQINFVDALGTLITGKEHNAYSIGLLVHLFSGAAWGIFYLLIINMLGVDSFLPAVAMSMLIGFFHGLLTIYGLLAFISERHPIEKYRRATMVVGVIHWFGHVIFGATLGALIGLFLI